MGADSPQTDRGLYGCSGLRPAREIGVDLAAIVGSGRGGRIVEADVRAAAAAGTANRRAADPDAATTETQGAVFSVTNLGAHRVDAFTPLLDLPQAAILGLGRARPRPAVVDGRVVARTLMVLSLTFDHRVVDGEPAAAFLDVVVSALERLSVSQTQRSA